MFGKKYTWVKFADSESALAPFSDCIGTIQVNGNELCVAKYENHWFGFASHCPHAGGFLSEGYIDQGGHIVCPIHCYKFNLKNGRISEGDGYILKTYPVECRANGVFIGFEEKRAFPWPRSR